MSEFKEAVVALSKDPRTNGTDDIPNILTKEINRLFKRYKIKADVFVYFPKIHFPVEGDKADILIEAKIKSNG